MDNMPIPPPLKRPPTNNGGGAGAGGGPPISPMTPTDSTVHLSFNVPFSSNLPGPDPAEILHASPKAIERWTFPEGTEEGTPLHELPVHHGNVEQLRRMCRVISESRTGRIEATVTSCEPKTIPLLLRPMKGLITNVCLSGDADSVQKTRAKVLNESPIMLVQCPDSRTLSSSAMLIRDRNVLLSILIPTS